MLGKAIAKEATKHEEPVKMVFVKGFGWIKDIPMTFEQKMQVIRGHEEAGKDFIEAVIKDAQTQDSLKSIAGYLKDYPTELLSINTKAELLRDCMTKLIKMAKEDKAIQEWVSKNTLRLIGSVVDFLA